MAVVRVYDKALTFGINTRTHERLELGHRLSMYILRTFPIDFVKKPQDYNHWRTTIKDNLHALLINMEIIDTNSTPDVFKYRILALKSMLDRDNEFPTFDAIIDKFMSDFQRDYNMKWQGKIIEGSSNAFNSTTKMNILRDILGFFDREDALAYFKKLGCDWKLEELRQFVAEEIENGTSLTEMLDETANRVFNTGFTLLHSICEQLKKTGKISEISWNRFHYHLHQFKYWRESFAASALHPNDWDNIKRGFSVISNDAEVERDDSTISNVDVNGTNPAINQDIQVTVTRTDYESPQGVEYVYAVNATSFLKAIVTGDSVQVIFPHSIAEMVAKANSESVCIDRGHIIAIPLPQAQQLSTPEDNTMISAEEKEQGAGEKTAAFDKKHRLEKSVGNRQVSSEVEESSRSKRPRLGVGVETETAELSEEIDSNCAVAVNDDFSPYVPLPGNPVEDNAPLYQPGSDDFSPYVPLPGNSVEDNTLLYQLRVDDFLQYGPLPEVFMEDNTPLYQERFDDVPLHTPILPPPTLSQSPSTEP